jgi:CHASE2 domain-containing sensor protein
MHHADSGMPYRYGHDPSLPSRAKGMSNWLIEVGILTAGLFLCLLARVASPPFRTSTVAAACLLFVGCLAAVVIHVAVPPLPD